MSDDDNFCAICIVCCKKCTQRSKSHDQSHQKTVELQTHLKETNELTSEQLELLGVWEYTQWGIHNFYTIREEQNNIWYEEQAEGFGRIAGFMSKHDDWWHLFSQRHKYVIRLQKRGDHLISQFRPIDETHWSEEIKAVKPWLGTWSYLAQGAPSSFTIHQIGSEYWYKEQVGGEGQYLHEQMLIDKNVAFLESEAFQFEIRLTLIQDAIDLQYRPHGSEEWSDPTPATRLQSKRTEFAREYKKVITRKKLKFVFQPGALGMDGLWEWGIVDYVAPGKQAHKLGIQPGWKILALNGYKYTENLLDRLIAGDKPFEITFDAGDEENFPGKQTSAPELSEFQDENFPEKGASAPELLENASDSDAEDMFADLDSSASIPAKEDREGFQPGDRVESPQIIDAAPSELSFPIPPQSDSEQSSDQPALPPPPMSSDSESTDIDEPPPQYEGIKSISSTPIGSFNHSKKTPQNILNILSVDDQEGKSLNSMGSGEASFEEDKVGEPSFISSKIGERPFLPGKVGEPSTMEFSSSKALPERRAPEKRKQEFVGFGNSRRDPPMMFSDVRHPNPPTLLHRKYEGLSLKPDPTMDPKHRDFSRVAAELAPRKKDLQSQKGISLNQLTHRASPRKNDYSSRNSISSRLFGADDSQTSRLPGKATIPSSGIYGNHFPSTSYPGSPFSQKRDYSTQTSSNSIAGYSSRKGKSNGDSYGTKSTKYSAREPMVSSRRVAGSNLRSGVDSNRRYDFSSNGKVDYPPASVFDDRSVTNLLDIIKKNKSKKVIGRGRFHDSRPASPV